MTISNRERQMLERRLAKVDAQLVTMISLRQPPYVLDDRVVALRKTAAEILATLEASATEE